MLLAWFCCFLFLTTSIAPSNGKSLLSHRRKRATEDCKIDTEKNTWNTGKIGELRVKINETAQVGDEIVIAVEFTEPLSYFRAWGQLQLETELNEEGKEADVLFILKQWMVNNGAVKPGSDLVLGYQMTYAGAKGGLYEESVALVSTDELLKRNIYNQKSFVAAVIVLINDEEDDEEKCEGGEGGESVKTPIPTGNVTCDKIFKIIENRPGQVQGLLEFVSPVDAEDMRVEFALSNPAQNFNLDGMQRLDDDGVDCAELENKVHFFEQKKRNIVAGQTVRNTINLNYDQNDGTSPTIEAAYVQLGDDTEIYCGEIPECPDEGSGDGDGDGDGEDDE